ncbi:hypothetical protein QTP86_001209 [Hemibagrus guttatus]|nr:hypothetical protein QTP86_001209 [Hemibagrus guttatus]
MLRFSLGVTRLDRIRNEYIRGTAHVGRLGDKVREARLRWFGHVQRRETGAVDSSITPDQTIISSSEGSIITLTCTYDDSAYNLHWYRQKPHSEPEFLLLIHKSTDGDTKAAHDPRLSTKVYFGLES